METRHVVYYVFEELLAVHLVRRLEPLAMLLIC